MTDEILKEEDNSIATINYIVGLTDVIEDRSDALVEIANNTPHHPITTTHLATTFFPADLELIEHIISTTGAIETELSSIEKDEKSNMSQSKKDIEQCINVPEIYFTVSSDISDDNSNLYEKRNKIIIEARSAENMYNNINNNDDSLDKKSNKDDKDNDHNNINNQ